MADIHIPARARRLRDTVAAALFAFDAAVHGQAVAGAVVATVAVALQMCHVELQYVVGAFVVVFAQTIARKKVSRDVVVQQPEPPRIRPELAKMFGGEKDPIGEALDR